LQAKILVVDDNPLNVELLEAYLNSSDYITLTAYNGIEALEQVSKNTPDLILLDVMMPEMDGYEVCRKLKNEEDTRLIPIIMLTALHDVQDRIKGIEAGADDFISKPFNNVELLTRVKSLLRIKRLNDELESIENVLFSLAAVIEAKDPYTRGHSERVALYAERLAKEIGLTEEDQKSLRRAGFLHDIGKIGISSSILNKPGQLSDAEISEINKHSSISELIIKPLKSANTILPAIKHHHERWNGTGVPDALTGENIPLFARILMIADIFDALTTDRPYRNRLSFKEAINELEQEAGTTCDPRLVEVFAKMIRKAIKTDEDILKVVLKIKPTELTNQIIDIHSALGD
jgi:putative two-component system response regulator